MTARNEPSELIVVKQMESHYERKRQGQLAEGY